MIKSIYQRILIRPLSLFAVILAVTFTCPSCKGGSGDRPLGPEVLDNPATAGNPAATLNGQPVIRFDKDEHNFGKVIQGEVISYSFKVSNVGEGPLVIADVTSTCGCTVGEYPREPLQPGEEGYIRVTFDSKGRQGFQSKVVTVVANTQPSSHPLRVIADVVMPETNQ